MAHDSTSSKAEGRCYPSMCTHILSLAYRHWSPTQWSIYEVMKNTVPEILTSILIKILNPPTARKGNDL